MFGATQASTRPALPSVKIWDDLTRLQHEFHALGSYLSAHPLDNYGPVLERIGVVAAGQVVSRQRATGPNRFKLAGIVVSKQERTSKNGNKFAFVALSDQSGAFEVTVFSELLAARRDILETGQAVLLEVDVQSAQPGFGGGAGGKGGQEVDELRYIARSIEPLAVAAERASQGIRVRLYEPSSLPEIQKLLAAIPSGRGKIMLRLELDDGEEADWDLPGGWAISEGVKSNLRNIGSGLEVTEA
jgi:DNA polymerase-3 subunit alpha